MSTFIEQELQDYEDPDTSPHFKRKTTFRTIFCSKLAKGSMVAFVIAVLVPTLAYFLVISRNVPDKEDTDHYSCLIREEFRVPCGVVGISATKCSEINCCFNATTQQCHHYLPSKYYYTSQTDGTYLSSQDKSPVETESVPYIKLTVQNKTANKLSLIIHDPSEAIEPINTDSPNYSIKQNTKKLVVEVFDLDGDSIFNTAKGALIASEKYWEWSFELPNGTLFGLDQNLIQLNSNENMTTVIYKSKVDHSTLPVFWVYRNGKFYGTVIRHDGPMEIQVFSSNMIVLRSLLGKRIEIELSLGPKPEDLYMDQIEEMILPPRWSLGTHNCRKGDTTKLNEILDIYNSNIGLSFDTDCVHENLFIALQSPNKSEDDLTTLTKYIDEAINGGQKFLLSLPPHILVNESNELYERAKNLDLLFKNQAGVIYNGTYLGQKVVYPDFSTESINDYIQTLISWIDGNLGLQRISGFVLNDNWPQDDSYLSADKSYFPYYSDAIDRQMKFTLPATLQGSDKALHFEKHNAYGQYQNASLHAYLNSLMSLTDEPLIISSTKMYGNTEPEISDNFDTSWDNFRMYLNKILFSSITGNRMVGLPVCGDTESYNKTLHEVLCVRWYIAAATMPYFRVSSGDIFRDPANLNTKYATKIAETAMNRRSLLQDYLFTILSKREPVVTPMYYYYYPNKDTFSMESQYTIGKDIIVAHPLSSGKVKLQIYLPIERSVWYEFWGGAMFTPQKINEYVDIDTFEADWAMMVAQGTIVGLTKSTQLQLYIALNCSSSETGCVAEGDLFKDNNMLLFSATNTSVTINGLPSDCPYSLTYLRVYGYIDRSGYVLFNSTNVDLCTEGAKSVTINYND